MIIFAFTWLTACASPPAPTQEEPARPPSQVAPSATENQLVTPPTLEPATTPTAEPTSEPVTQQTPEPVVYPFEWSGTWNVWIGNPKISIVNTAVFEVDQAEVRSSWYEGTRLVTLEGTLSEDGSILTGTFWNSDVEALDITLLLDPSGAFFTGIADSETGAGQFCGTRSDPSRPSPCRAEVP